MWQPIVLSYGLIYKDCEIKVITGEKAWKMQLKTWLMKKVAHSGLTSMNTRMNLEILGL